ncbi:MAG: hypothetical protein ACREMD_00460 [Gemmatimonadota bacterium]
MIGKLQELAARPERIRPFLNREIRQLRAGRQELERRATALDRQIAELEGRQRETMDWLAETLPGKAAARKLNEKIEIVEQEKCCSCCSARSSSLWPPATTMTA